ncbi:helix-turn-helix transcriptional regulator [Pseudarthrobacter sp. fls2-241-R2A-127]|uniref:helix-turn-helix transcriptional regulator n=1 Tax=Pseudarthrobacter sp. fls2-241-R2A-127 TaxID=3040303 RepID=UPI0025533571|nr:helix-turn-helix transcriptional regulator [Pseudarthrobacter sp. fls2-241-R2A-127]
MKLAAELMHLPGQEEYLLAASDVLLKLVPSDHVAWNEVNPSAGYAEVRAYPDHSGIDIPKMLLELVGEHPVVASFKRHPHDSLRRLSDVVSDRDLYRSRAFREGLSLLNVNRQLVALTSDVGSSVFRCWSMNRWGHDFSDNEVDLTARLQPMLRLLERTYAGDDASWGQFQAQRYSLTARELEVLQLLDKGITIVAIGHLLGISPRTVAKHLEHSYAKLGCTNRIEALRRMRGDR